MTQTPRDASIGRLVGSGSSTADSGDEIGFKAHVLEEEITNVLEEQDFQIVG